MKTKINIILGMLDSGKSTLINSFLNNTNYKDEKIVVIQEEQGKVEIGSSSENTVIILKNKSQDEIDVVTLKEIVNDYIPDRIIIEFNGMHSPEKLIKSIKSSNLNSKCKLDKVFMTIDSNTAKMYLMNMGDILRTPIFYSDVIILNNRNNMNKESISLIKNEINMVNEVAKLFVVNSKSKLDKLIKDKELYLEKSKGYIKNLFDSLIVILTIMLVYFLFKTINFNNKDLSDTCEKVINVFTGIVFEGIPFIFIGSLISSFIEVFIPQDIIIKIFSKNKFISMVVASILGLFIPVCDCGTIPLARTLIRKNIPISTVITFILAAPIVNPVAIMSSIYAFPNMKEIALYRIVIGISVALIVGFISGIKADKNIIVSSSSKCNCSACNIDDYKNKSLISKINILFIRSSDEFFYVCKYMILGALFASVTQSLINKGTLLNIHINDYTSIIIMMIFAFVFSVCSTSDSFVAKSFIGNFSKVSIIGFLVLGPMIDIKNTIMLFSNFKKSFVVRLIISIVITTSILLAMLMVLGGVV